MAPRRILIFANDPRLCRLLLREAVAAGCEAEAITEVDKLEERYRSSDPGVILMEVDRFLDSGKRFIRLVSGCRSGSLVLLSAVSGPHLGELTRLADALGVKINGILHQPMGIEAIRAVLRHPERVTPSHSARPTTQEVDHEREQVTR